MKMMMMMMMMMVVNSSFFACIFQIKYFYDRGDFRSLSQASIDSFATHQRVSVFLSGEHALVCVHAKGNDLQRGQWCPSRKFFNRLKVRNLMMIMNNDDDDGDDAVQLHHNYVVL